jgi:N-acetylmuramoyl-L-alanine amidase
MVMAGPGPRQRPVVVLDPGHGGNDAGATSTTGKLEKDIVLSFGQLLKGRLQRDFDVTLTRTGDFWIDIPSRTAKANAIQADVFVSLHVAASFRHQTNGLSVYYQAASSRKPLADTEPDALVWSDVQTGHEAAARRLAAVLTAEIRAGGALPIKVAGSPLAVLSGADMPAVLIELGYASNPIDEQRLADPAYLQSLADAIAEGITTYFKTKQNVEL